MHNSFYSFKSPQEESLATKRRLRLFAVCVVGGLLISYSAMAQGQTVSGRVTSKNQEPLPGVSILVKGSTIGTSTDADGKYTVQVPQQNGVLVFSFIGFATQEVSVGSQTQIDVQLSEDVTQLTEVVVTALGISQEKRSLGYSVQEVKGQDIAQTQRSNFLVSLQGRVAGLTMTPTSGLPGASASINLRGLNSLSGSNQPIIVVDGLVINNATFDQHRLVSDLDNRGNDYTNRGADINPNDIESITVLKGPEAAALYGQDGGSGAIIITTKKGSKGQGKISYDNSFGFQQVYRFPEVQTVYGRGTNGNTDQAALGYFGPRYADGTKFYNNKEEFFETGFSQNHNLSLEGGNDEATYRLSTNFLNQKGTVPTSEFKKMSVRLSGTSKISNTLDVSTSFNYIYTDNIKPIRGEYGFLMSVLAWPSNDTIANYLNKNGSRKKLTTSESETDNPFFTVYKNKNKDQTNRIVGNIALTLKPTSWLSVIGRFGADIYSTQGNYFLHPESFNGSTARYGGRITKGSVDNYNDNSKLFNGTLLTTAKKDFGKFRTSLMVGGAFDDSRAEVNSLKGEQLLLPNYNSINNTTQTTQRNKNSITQKRIVSMLGNITVNYGDLVYLNLSGRNDWSSTLPIENRSFFYPSAALSFVFTELPSIDNLKFLSYGKFRASYAEVGKDAMPYKISPSLESRPYTGGGFAYGFFGGNPKLAPEKAKGYEVGAELKFFEKRLGLDISLYKNDRFNQIYSQRLSYATGFVFALLNGGDFSNKGIEIQLTGIPVQTRDFEWSVLLNFTKSKTTVSDLPAKVYEAYNSDTWLYGNARGSAFAPNLQDYFPTTNLAFNQDGKGVATAIGGYSYLRNDRGDILISPSTGLPVVNTNFLPIGDRNPDFSIGLTNTLAYKNLSLSFLLDLRKGGDVFNGNEMYLYRNGLSKRSLDRETPVVFNGVLRDGNENTETPTANTIQVTPYTMGTTFFNSIPESEFVEHNIDWLRLRDITINYRFSGKLLGSQKIIRTAGIFVTATDLFLITNYSGADPGVNGTTPATTGAGAAGIDFGSLALPRTITFGISLGL